MFRSATIVASAVLFAPSIASAADVAAAQPSGAAGLVTAIAAGLAGLLTAGAAMVSAARSRRAAESATATAQVATVAAASAESRSARALAWADRIANAQADGVVLVLSYPGTRSCRGLLEANGWRIEHYEITQLELDAGVLLPGPALLDDVRVADAIVVEGLDEGRMAMLSAQRPFRDAIRSGAGVVMYTGGPNRRYDLTLWGECDQGVTMPVTAEAAVRASLARREATARRQGVRPGQLGAARAALLAEGK